MNRESAKSAEGAVHASHAHDSAVKHVTGEAVYIDDILEPAGLLHVYFGTSRCARGSLRQLDLGRVKAEPGVVAVITAADIPGLNDISPTHTLDEEILVEVALEAVTGLCASGADLTGHANDQGRAGGDRQCGVDGLRGSGRRRGGGGRGRARRRRGGRGRHRAGRRGGAHPQPRLPLQAPE